MRDTGWNPSLALGPGDFPAISYYSATMGDLLYVYGGTPAARTFMPLVNR
jgi:hypothetical protein